MTVDPPDAGAAGDTTPSIPPPFSVRTEHGSKPGAVRLVLGGELDLAAAPQLHAELDALADARRLVVDLRDLAFIDSSGIAAFISLARTRTAPGALRFTRPRFAVRRTLELAQVLDLLPFSDDDAR